MRSPGIIFYAHKYSVTPQYDSEGSIEVALPAMKKREAGSQTSNTTSDFSFQETRRKSMVNISSIVFGQTKKGKYVLFSLHTTC